MQIFEIMNTDNIHTFSRTLAGEHGINAAILLAFLAKQVPIYQMARNDNLGYYNSIRGLAEHYPYLTQNIIGYTLNKLRENNIISTGVHNKKGYDKTLWYTFTTPAVQKSALEDPVRFNAGVATQFGVEAALVFANIKHWIEHNQNKDINYIWHRVSPLELAKHLPIPERTIRRALKKLSEGEGRLLDRDAGDGFDRAFYYRIWDGKHIERTGSTTHRSISALHRSESITHRSNYDIHRPDPLTNTSYKDTVAKTSVEKNICKTHIQTTPASPDVCVCVDQNSACGAETCNDSSQPTLSINASGKNSGHGINQPIDANILGKQPSECTQVLTSNDSIADSTIGYCPSESDYVHLEKVANLSAEQKMRVFRSAVHNLNNNGRGVQYIDKTFGKARKFFELNPTMPVATLLAALENCLNLAACVPIGGITTGYDPLFHVRRAGNLNFFFKHLPTIGAWEGADLGMVRFDNEDPTDAAILGQCSAEHCAT